MGSVVRGGLLAAYATLHMPGSAQLDPSLDPCEASLPLEWSFRGLVLGPREVAPVIRSAVWVAWARGPNGEHQQGEGDYPEGALLDLAAKLKAIRPDPHG
jgi:hypothetical protein